MFGPILLLPLNILSLKRCRFTELGPWRYEGTSPEVDLEARDDHWGHPSKGLTVYWGLALRTLTFL